MFFLSVNLLPLYLLYLQGENVCYLFSEPDKRLFTPGPLLTSATVKEAMLRDLGSRDSEFIETIKIFREGLLKVAG